MEPAPPASGRIMKLFRRSSRMRKTMTRHKSARDIDKTSKTESAAAPGQEYGAAVNAKEHPWPRRPI
jgi:hypothetical protein